MRLFEGTQFDIPPKCDECGLLESECKCPPAKPEQIPPEKQRLKVSVEKRKRGKLVTVVRGLAEANDHASLLTDLKNHCGSGGTFKDGTIEIQGDHVERATAYLLQLGYRIR